MRKMAEDDSQTKIENAPNPLVEVKASLPSSEKKHESDSGSDDDSFADAQEDFTSSLNNSVDATDEKDESQADGNGNLNNKTDQPSVEASAVPRIDIHNTVTEQHICSPMDSTDDMEVSMPVPVKEESFEELRLSSNLGGNLMSSKEQLKTLSEVELREERNIDLVNDQISYDDFSNRSLQHTGITGVICSSSENLNSEVTLSNTDSTERKSGPCTPDINEVNETSLPDITHSSLEDSVDVARSDHTPPPSDHHDSINNYTSFEDMMVQSRPLSDSSFEFVEKTQQMVDATAFESPGLLCAADSDRKHALVHQGHTPSPPPESAADVLLSENVASEVVRPRRKGVRHKDERRDSDTHSSGQGSVEETLSESIRGQLADRKSSPKRPLIDPSYILDLEKQAKELSSGLEDMMSGLQSNLHAMTLCTHESILLHSETAEKMQNTVDSSVKAMYSFLSKFNELYDSLRPIKELSEQVSEINENLKALERIF